jgi:hypothetical protein
MPELEKLIADWRANLNRTVADEDIARELEAHLRDHIETLRRAGVSAPSAFEQAARRLGEPGLIAREFSRSRSRWRPESAPEWVLLLLALAVAALTCLAAARYAEGRMTLVMATHVFAVATGYLIAFANGLIGACALVTAWWRPLTEPERRKLQRTLFRLTAISTVCLPVGMALGMVWAAKNLGRAWAWAPGETGAAFVLFSSLLLLFAQLRRVPDRVRYIIAVIGGVILTIGWVGARAATSVPITWLCGAFAAAQIAVLLVRSPPPRIQPTN